MVDFIDYWNNIFWLLECVIDIYCDLVDWSHLGQDIEILVNNIVVIHEVLF